MIPVLSGSRLRDTETEFGGPRLIRTGSLLALTCCYLMWMVTYMAQLHPLIGAHNLWSRCCRRLLIAERVNCSTGHGPWARVNRFRVGFESLYRVS